MSKSSDKKEYVNNLIGNMEKWKKDFQLSPSERRTTRVYKVITGILGRIFIGENSLNEKKWIALFEDRIKKDNQLFKMASGFNKQKVKYWINMNKSAIKMLKLYKEYNPLHLKTIQTRKEFLNKKDFKSAKEHISILNAQRILLRKMGNAYKERVGYQKKLILLTKQKAKSIDFNWTESILIDLFTFYCTDNKIPITTSIKLIRKFGIITWTNAYSVSLQTKQLDTMGDRFLKWEKVLKEDLQRLDQIN